MNEEGTQKQSFFDKVHDMVDKVQPQKPDDPANYVNSRTQSMVISDRESAEQELLRIRAEQDQQAHEQIVEERVETAKKTGVYVIIAAICVILLILVAILVFTLIPYLKKPTHTVVDPTEINIEKTNIGFYECLTKDCKEMVTLQDGRKLIRDGNYVILDDETEEIFTTALDGDYQNAMAFGWGEKLYVHAVLENGNGAIFSISDNKYISGDVYTEIYSDISDEVYLGQEWVEGKYIIAKRSGDYRLIDISNGKEKVQGVKKVYATKNGFFVAFDQDGKHRLFSPNNVQLALVESGSMFELGDYIAVVEDDEGLSVYDENEEVTSDYKYKDELESIPNEELAKKIASMPGARVIPD